MVHDLDDINDMEEEDAEDALLVAKMEQDLKTTRTLKTQS